MSRGRPCLFAATPMPICIHAHAYLQPRLSLFAATPMPICSHAHTLSTHNMQPYANHTCNTIIEVIIDTIPCYHTCNISYKRYPLQTSSVLGIDTGEIQLHGRETVNSQDNATNHVKLNKNLSYFRNLFISYRLNEFSTPTSNHRQGNERCS